MGRWSINVYWTNECITQSIVDIMCVHIHTYAHVCACWNHSAYTERIAVIICKKYSLSTSLEYLRVMPRLCTTPFKHLLPWPPESSGPRISRPCLCSGEAQSYCTGEGSRSSAKIQTVRQPSAHHGCGWSQMWATQASLAGISKETCSNSFK